LNNASDVTSSRRVGVQLLVMAAIVVATFAYEIVNRAVADDWGLWPWLIARAVVPLGLIAAVWRGHDWARYALAMVCVVLIVKISPHLVDLPRMLENGKWPAVGYVLLVVGGHLAIGLLALFSPALVEITSQKK